MSTKNKYRSMPRKHLEFINTVKLIELHPSCRRGDCVRDMENQVPYRISSPSTASLCGAAFYFLTRVETARYIGSNPGEALGSTKQDTEERSPFENELSRRYEEYAGAAAKYIKGDEANYEDIVAASWAYSLLLETRNGRVPRSEAEAAERLSFSKTEAFKEAAAELLEMAEVFRREFLGRYVGKNSAVVYDPSFGAVSDIVGNLDGNMLMDGTLYEFNVSKKTGYEEAFYYKMLGRFLAWKALFSAGVKYSPETEILRVGVYKARYGTVEYLDTELLYRANSVDMEYAISRIAALMEETGGTPKDLRPVGDSSVSSICLFPSKGGPGEREGNFYVARRPGYAEPASESGFGGKWVVVADSRYVDFVWRATVEGVLEGKLGDLALCGVPREDGKYVVLVRVPDYRDVNETERIGRVLMASLPRKFLSINFSADDEREVNKEGKRSLFTLHRFDGMLDRRP